MVESGRVGVRSGRRLIAVLFPKMVLGEAAIFGVDGTAGRRTASVFALDADTGKPIELPPGVEMKDL